MSDLPHDDSAQLAEDALDPENLPPVEPPSAGFILQLFLVPAIIVMVVVGVWLLFGKMASGEQDWRKQLAELRSSNVHSRWRGANALAHLLELDKKRGDDGEHLAENRLIATELSNLLVAEIKSGSEAEDHQNHNLAPQRLQN